MRSQVNSSIMFMPDFLGDGDRHQIGACIATVAELLHI